MNFEFIEGRETGDKVIKFGGVGKRTRKSSTTRENAVEWVWWRKSMGGGGFGVAMLGKEGDKTKLGQETRLGEARDSLKNITE